MARVFKKFVTGNNLKPLHKKAARLYLAGLTHIMIGKELGVKPSQVQSWTMNLKFIKYVDELEKKYHAVFDKEIMSLRRHAFHVLKEGLTSEDLYHQRWAVSTILNSTQVQEMTLNLKSSVEGGDPLDDRAKKAAKEYMMLTSGTRQPMIEKNAEA